MTETTRTTHDCDGWDSCPNPAHRANEPGEAHYVEFGWSGCAGSAWSSLPPAAKDGWAHAERLAAGQQLATRCTCDPVPLSCNGEGPSETCEIHGRAYAEWVERGDILNARLEAVKEVIAKARATPVANDPFRVALDIADELEAAVYLEPGVWPPDHGKVIADLRAALTGEPVECCASGRCEVCTPGYVW